MSAPFADRSASRKREELEASAKAFEDMRDSLTRLVKNEDFRAWFGYFNLEFGGSSFGQSELGAFEQGRRAAIDSMRALVAFADGGPEFLADLTRNHFAAIAKARVEARRTKETENT